MQSFSPDFPEAEAMLLPGWLQDLCDRLKANDGELQNLNLNLRSLDGPWMAALSNALSNNRTLTVLNLTSSVSKSQATESLAGVLLSNRSQLQVLHLGYNRLTQIDIGSALSHNTSLLELHLSYNSLGCDSAIAIADGLSRNGTLKILQLGNNMIGDHGCAALASMLKTNNSLQVLGLKRNCITSIHLLEDSLDTNMCITDLDLDSTTNGSTTAFIQIVCRANRAGRRLLMRSTNPVLWLEILAKVRYDPDVLFFLLQWKPEMIGQLCGRLECRKRKHEDLKTSVDV